MQFAYRLRSVWWLALLGISVHYGTGEHAERATNMVFDAWLQGGIESEENYPYCSGFGKCLPCAAPGYNRTRCGPPVPPTSCLKNESCIAKKNSSNFVPNLTLKSWVAIEKVSIHPYNTVQPCNSHCYRMKALFNGTWFRGVHSQLPSMH